VKNIFLALHGDFLFGMVCVMGFCTQKCVMDFIFRNPGMDVQEIISLHTCFGFIPLTRDVRMILFSLFICFRHHGVFHPNPNPNPNTKSGLNPKRARFLTSHFLVFKTAQPVISRLYARYSSFLFW